VLRRKAKQLSEQFNFNHYKARRGSRSAKLDPAICANPGDARETWGADSRADHRKALVFAVRGTNLAAGSLVGVPARIRI